MRALGRAHFLLQVDTILAHADSRSPRPPSPFNRFDCDDKPSRAQRLKAFQQLAKDGSMSAQLTFPSPCRVACAVQQGLCVGDPELQQPSEVRRSNPSCHGPSRSIRHTLGGRRRIPVSRQPAGGSGNCLCRPAVAVAQAQGIGTALGKTAPATSHFCQRDRRHLDRVPVRPARGFGGMDSPLDLGRRHHLLCVRAWHLGAGWHVWTGQGHGWPDMALPADWSTPLTNTQSPCAPAQQ